MPRGYSGGGSVSVSGVNWSAVAAALQDGPKEIRTEFNRRTREIGKPIMSAMREAVQGTSASVSSSGGSQYRRLAWSAGHRSSGPMTFRAARRFSGLSAGGGEVARQRGAHVATDAPRQWGTDRHPHRLQ